MKITATLIVGPNEPFLDRCLRSCFEIADDVIVVTNATEGYVITTLNDIKTEYGDRIAIKYRKWDDNFAASRNYALQFISADTDFMFWMDADDYIPNAEALRQVIERAPDDVDVILLPYHYATDEYGNPIKSCWRERFLRMSKRPKWQGSVHEVCVLQDGVRNSWYIDHPIKHLGRGKERGNRSDKVLRRLIEEVNEHPGDPRPKFYLAREYFYRGEYDQSIKWFKEYLKYDTAPSERLWAHLYLGDIYSQNDPQQAEAEYLNAIRVEPRQAEAYFKLGVLAYQREDWVEAEKWLEAARAIPKPNRYIFINESVYLYEPDDYLQVVYWKLGKHDEALRACRTVLKYRPHDQRIKDNLCLLESQLRKGLRIKGTIGFYVGKAAEKWNRETVEQGLGGRETSNALMAEELHKLGWRTVVFADCEDMEGNFNGVEYVDFRKTPQYLLENQVDIFFSSGRTKIFDLNLPVKVKILWSHDADYGKSLEEWPDYLTDERISRIDYFFFMSPWQRDNLFRLHPAIPRHRSYLTRSGIKLYRFEGLDSIERNRYRAIYSSSPDRGLVRLLDLWPRIRKEVPQAELHVFYGFKTYDGCTKSYPDPEIRKRREEWKRFVLDKLANTEGVEFHGRIPKNELAKEFAKSRVWTYPTHFTETMCLSALEAMAAGCVPVTTRLGALVTTVDEGGILIDGDPDSEEYQSRFVEEVVKLMTDDDYFVQWQGAGRRQISKGWDWADIAREWDVKLQQILDIEHGVGLIREAEDYLRHDNPLMAKEILAEDVDCIAMQLLNIDIAKRLAHLRDKERYIELYEADIKADEEFRAEAVKHCEKFKAVAEILGTGPGEVLDIGCGKGEISALIADMGFKVVGIDISAQGIEIAKRHAGDKCEFIQMDLIDLPTLGRKFDYILMLDVLEHVPDWEEAVAAARVMLKPRGKLIICVPQGGHDADIANRQVYLSRYFAHVREITIEDLRLMLPGIRVHREIKLGEDKYLLIGVYSDEIQD